MPNEKHNTIEDFEAKQYVPEGFNLDVDRAFTAETIVTDINEWKKQPNKVDLAGFDTKSRKEPSLKQIRKAIVGRPSGEVVLLEEPGRFVNPTHQTRKLLEKHKDEITDFNSFKEVVRKAWSSDNSLQNLLANVADFDTALQPLYNQKVVQGWVDKNTRQINIAFLIKRFNIEPVRASRVLNFLSPKAKQKLYRLAKSGRLPKKVRFRIKSASRPRKPSRQCRKWTEEELRFIESNIHLPAKKVAELFKSALPYHRSVSAIMNKTYSLKKKTQQKQKNNK